MRDYYILEETGYPAPMPPPVPPDYIGIVMYAVTNALGLTWCGKNDILSEEKEIIEINPDTGEQRVLHRRENCAKGVLLAAEGAMAFKEQLLNHAVFTIVVPETGIFSGVGSGPVTVLQGVQPAGSGWLKFVP